MSDLVFRVVNATAERYAASPTLNLRLRLEDPVSASVESVALHCQVRIEPQRRRYATPEEQRLLELFGDRDRWADTLKPFLWTHVNCLVPGFTGSAEIDLPVHCSYDMEVAATKYFHALEDGEIPLNLLFSGTVFWRGPAGLTVRPISWSRECSYRLPVAVWREVMDLYFPGSGWVRLRRETLDALLAIKTRRALGSWDEVIQALVRSGGETPPPRRLGGAPSSPEVPRTRRMPEAPLDPRIARERPNDA